MSHTETGTITRLSEVKQISDKFSIQEFILETAGQYAFRIDAA